MPTCTLLFGELSQLVHNAALGAAAICGNLGIAPATTLSAEPTRDIEPGKYVSAPDSDIFLAAGFDSPFSPAAGRDSVIVQRELTHLQRIILQQNGFRSINHNYVMNNDDQRNETGPSASVTTGSGQNAMSHLPTSEIHSGNRRATLTNLFSSTAPVVAPMPVEEANTADVAIDLTGGGPMDAGKEESQGAEPDTSSRGGLTLQGGYSSVEGISVGGRIARRRVFGPTSEVSASAHYSKVRTSFQVGYSDTNLQGVGVAFAPTLFANRLSATGFGNGVGRTPFSQSARGLNILVNRKFADGLSASINYRISDDSFRFSHKDAICDATILGSPICGEIGNRTSSILSLALTFDEKIRHAGNRHRFRLRLVQDLGVGGSGSFARTRLSSEVQIGLGSGLNWSFDAEGGYIAPIGEDKIPLFERFYIGDSSMRGFDLRGIGPKVRPTAALAEQNVAIGGRAYYVGRTELSVNIGGIFGKYGVQPGIFVDAGSVFLASKNRLLPGETLIGNSPKPRVSVGVGLALNTPAGKLRVDFVRPIVKQEGDRPKLLSISFGTSL